MLTFGHKGFSSCVQDYIFRCDFPEVNLLAKRAYKLFKPLDPYSNPSWEIYNCFGSQYLIALGSSRDLAEPVLSLLR